MVYFAVCNSCESFGPQAIDRFNLFTSVKSLPSNEGFSSGAIKAVEEVASQSLPISG
jgi:HAE1 family hydrophobic/amphiphilic exporter-1